MSILFAVGLISISAGFIRLDTVVQHVQSNSLPPELINLRYVQHPVVTFIHIGSGIIFMLLAPLQFSPGIRRRIPKLHRIIGRTALVAAITTATISIWMAISFPAFGGWLTATSTYVFGSYVIVCFALAYAAARNRQIDRHKKWIIRGVIVSFGVSSIRILFIVFAVATDLQFEEFFPLAFALGFALNAVLAELVVRRRSAIR